MLAVYRVCLLLGGLLLGMHALAQTETPDDAAYAAEAARAKALLNKAVAAYREQGDKAFAAFSRVGEFTDDELYVWVTDAQGVMLASGGPSQRLIGRDISSVLEPDVKASFEEALAQPEGPVREKQYRWMNWQDGKVELKHVYYQRVGDRMLAVGYYQPRAMPTQAKDLLDKAAKAVESDPQATIKAVNELDKTYYQDDLYVFIVDLQSHRYVAHGYNLRLVSTDFSKVKDTAGAPIGQEMLDKIKGGGEAQVSYQWLNPVTGRDERKTTTVRKVGNYLVAVGYYTPESPQ
ncbi:cache domain-containing protein [Pseudomonas sp. LS44]|uniref:cache domain-containing protein n=1 Tax=Pseudomonas sp. LS44 TaxID=1357074 RepID=UPI00215A5425|nr:cache domain-containing protein [Pseudomonas sp. LS44]UVE18697.1 cache domain-containing protein [Pseudomonas sp. LS44]